MPATFVHLLIFPTFWIPDTRFCFYVVKPHILRTFSVRPRCFTRYTTSMTSNTLIQVHDHCDLRFNLQASLPPSFYVPLHIHLVGFQRSEEHTSELQSRGH